ncbi:MAG: PD-(D/E)XK nuclease family protein [Chloroflexota bacterium]|nr:PD-(D/E)XK nuclease family protein [Chloroflexota bacterium]
MTGRNSPQLREALWKTVQEAKGGDLMAPVTVVSPSRYASLSLRQELGGEGFINVRFVQLPVLSELLGGAALAAQGRKPLTSTLHSISLRRVLAGTAGKLEQVRHHSRTQSSVRASFRELRRLDEQGLAELEAHGGVTGEVVGLYREHRRNLMDAWYDPEDLTAKAAEVVGLGQAAALDDLGHIVIFLPRTISPAEASLIGDLARDGRCSAILGLTGDAQADGPTEGLARDLEGVLGNAVAIDGTGDSPGALAGEADLHVAPTTHEELRWAIRQIVEEAGARGTPFHRMAVLYRMENPYGAVIRDEMALAGIPMAGPGRDTLAETTVGRTLRGLLSLAEKDFQRDELMDWLTSCPVSPPGVRAEGFNPTLWDTISRSAGVVGGLDQWRERLENYARNTIARADDDEKTDAISEARASAMRDSAAAGLELRRFVVELAEAVKPPVDGSKWEAFSDWASGLFTQYLDSVSAATNAAERERFESEKESVERILKEIAAADAFNAGDAVKAGATAEEFKQVVEASLQVPQGHLGPTGQGVFVSSFQNAVGMSFDRTWLVGMIEGSVPPAQRPDPLLPETALPSGASLTRSQRLAAQERYEYLSTLATAPRRTLSYPLADSGSRRRAHPSRWLLEQASALAGEQVHSGTLGSYGNRDWLTVTQSAEHALGDLDNGQLADELDFNLHRLVNWRRVGYRASSHPLAAEGTLARANKLSGNRLSRGFTEFDGNLSEAVANARYVRNLGRQAMSPTRLEAWATCPFRYFLGNVLRLAALEKPEDITVISPLERGSLVHAILERFIADSNAKGVLPPPGQPWGESDQVRLMEIAEEEFRQAEERGVTGKYLLWEMAKQNIRDDLARFLREEERLREGMNTGKVMVEARFGLGGDTPEVEDPTTGLRFRGIIDRVDISADGESVLVSDYKTGSINPYKSLDEDPIDRGKRLQLGIYSLAAQRLFPNASGVRAAYWFISDRGGFKLLPSEYFDIEDSDTAQRFRSGVSTVVEGIRSGVFPANPGSDEENNNCKYCEFDSLCTSRRFDAWERKKTDSQAAIYLELAEDE